jgi:hypothetical protein
VLSRGTQYSGNPAHDVVSMWIMLDQMQREDVNWFFLHPNHWA